MTGPAAGRAGLRRHAAFGVVLLLVLAGFARIAQYNWREGTTVIGGALLVAAVLRLALPPDGAGLLAIRGRALDVLLYAGFGVLVVLVALTITGGPLGDPAPVPGG